MLSYISTRGQAEPLPFKEAMLAGLASDGGLFLPASWPRFPRTELAALRGLPYADLVTELLWPFVRGSLGRDELAAHSRRAYAAFGHAAVAPLVQLGPQDWVMELFHGPTLAFKDFALQLLGSLFQDVLEREDRTITIIGATSGDTGSAAIRAVAGKPRMAIVMLHPEGRVSEVQRRQMTTVLDANVHNLAIEGTFDDCQALVKQLFNDAAFRSEARLAAVNSINWARIVAQAAYYVHAALSLGGPERPVAFSVPTGNFGDVYAGYVAHRIGLPIAKLVVATNRNDILARFLATGSYAKGEVHPTISPSMDIQVASNFERLLLDLLGDGGSVAAAMRRFEQEGSLAVPDDRLAGLRRLMAGVAIDEDATRAEMRRTLAATGYLADPHTAVGLAAARIERGDPAVPMVTLATAHPAKFPDAVEAATGELPPLPPRLADLLRRPERLERVPADPDAIRHYIRTRLGAP